MSDTALVIILAAIGIGIGFFAGMLVSNLRHSKESEDQGNRISPPLKNSDDMERLKDQVSYSSPDKESQDIDLVTDVVEQEKKRIQLNPLDIFVRAFQSDVQPQNPYDRSISVQIDEILQEMLETSPLKSRAIRLMELPSKGMVVMVGLDQYQGVDTIPDEDVRHIIRAAVAEWEKRAIERENLTEEFTET